MSLYASSAQTAKSGIQETVSGGCSSTGGFSLMVLRCLGFGLVIEMVINTNQRVYFNILTDEVLSFMNEVMNILRTHSIF